MSAVFPLPNGSPVKAGVFVLFTNVSQIPTPLLGEPLARRHLRDEWLALWALRLGVIGWGEQLHLTSALFQVDNAYWLWTFQGRLLQKNNKDRFCQLLWRPRPPTLLSQDQIKVRCPQQVRGLCMRCETERKSWLLLLSGWS